MNVTPFFMVAVGALLGIGVFLFTSASLWRRVVGLILLGNAVNFFLTLTGFRSVDQTREGALPVLSRPAVLGAAESGQASDPVSQALVLTAIVIGFAVLALVLVLHTMERIRHDDDHDEAGKGGGK